jgi:hypothetical protein
MGHTLKRRYVCFIATNNTRYEALFAARRHGCL